VNVSQSEGGTIKVEDETPASYPYDFTYTSGANVTVEAIPAAGYRFDGWTGSASDDTNPIIVKMTCAKHITANFVRIEHTLTIQVTGNGTTIPAAGTYNYYEGVTVAINASADEGWHFDNWSGDVVVPDSANATVIMNSDVTITANFAESTIPWLLIGGIIDGVLVLGVVFLLVMRRRKA
jgi:uncharacterized repeat protein (TIGR02543 family)